jgi:hypothetical protein
MLTSKERALRVAVLRTELQTELRGIRKARDEGSIDWDTALGLLGDARASFDESVLALSATEASYDADDSGRSW